MAGHGSKQLAGLALTRRDRFWQQHLGRIASSGGSANRYAETHGLSIGALYEAKRRLAARRAPALRVAFPVSPTLHASAGIRLRLASGAVLLGRIGSPR